MIDILAIIQARLGSTRLSRKVLLDLCGKTVLERVVERVRKSKLIDEVVVATTENANDDELIGLCDKIGVKVFRGSENDVLDRYYSIANKLGVKNIVRITSDCPLMDCKIIDEVVKIHLDKKNDYTSNTLEETFPDGEDVEVFTFDVLKKAWENAKLSSEREHVTPYIRKHEELFKLYNVKNTENLKDYRWTLDTDKDYEFIKLIYDNFRNVENFGMDEVSNFIKSRPEIMEINKNIIRNEGYLKSLREEN